MAEPLYTPAQVSKMLQVHPLTVLRYLKDGRLRGLRLGRVYRIRESDLQKFFDSHAT